jgi:hypothetical protein
LTRIPPDFSIFRIYTEFWIDLIHGVAVRQIVVLVTTSNSIDLFCTLDTGIVPVLIEGDNVAEITSLGELQIRYPLAARMITEGLAEQMAGAIPRAPTAAAPSPRSCP